MSWKGESRGRAPALQEQSPEFKTQSYQIKKIYIPTDNKCDLEKHVHKTDESVT
jgi:hypothetical protein